jgi:peptide/nickel transport system permease protein
MVKRSIVVAFAVALFAIFVCADLLRDYANAIDNVHWTGLPLPPCFVDATKCGGHWLGTDEVGRDLLARLIVATAVSLGISLCGAAFELAIFVGFLFIVESVAGSARLAVEGVAIGVSCFCAWPALLVIALITFDFEVRSSVRLAILALIAGALFTARSMPELPKKAKSWSFASGRVIRDWAAIILMLATIDFFGYGVQPPVPSWGNMLVGFQANFGIAWWAAVFPALCIFVAALLLEIGARAIP